jgi:hypothetical protein
VSISVTLHAFAQPDDGADACAFVYTETPTHVRCNVEKEGHAAQPPVNVFAAQDWQQPTTEVVRVYRDALTVGKLRAALDGRDDDMPVVMPGGEYDYTDAERCAVESVEWMDDPDDENEDNKYDRLCFVIHSSFG